MHRYRFASCFILPLILYCNAVADEPKPKRLLLLGQAPDGHPPATHEYLPGLKVLQACLKDVPGLTISIEHADEPWTDGPKKLADADGCVLFLSEGAKWLSAQPRRYEAFTRLAARGGGLVALHWAMGTKDAEPIAPFVRLLGGCHGGPDRRYAVIETSWHIAAQGHPIMTAVGPLAVRDEFYYRLKFVEPSDALQSLIRVPIEGRDETIAWAWQRPDGGRSFGFSGLHFHNNWRHEAYRRLISQAALWTLKLPIPAEGLPVSAPAELLELPAKDTSRGQE
jgi:type 1 glutamine amidotransferase